MSFMLQLFGAARLHTLAGEPISLSERKIALLSYLALAHSAVPRPVLAELLGDLGSDQEQRAGLRQTIYLIRKTLTEQAILVDGNGDISLNAEIVQADVTLFQKAMTNRTRPLLEAAIDMYRGPFLEGFKSPSSTFES